MNLNTEPFHIIAWGSKFTINKCKNIATNVALNISKNEVLFSNLELKINQDIYQE